MASVRSVGIHRPSALPFLVSEGYLATDPVEKDYHWQVFDSPDDGRDVVEEELIHTARCVVWSCGGLIKRVYSFDSEEEPVTHAVFSSFAADDVQQSENERHPSTGPWSSLTSEDNDELKVRKTGAGLQTPTDAREASFSSSHEIRRALVVILKTQAHVYFVSGTDHVVDLPFEVHSVFPFSRGLILQPHVSMRKSESRISGVPSAPTNTFRQSQTSNGDPDVDSRHLPSNGDLGSGVTGVPIFGAALGRLHDSVKRAAILSAPRAVCLYDPAVSVGSLLAKGTQQTASVVKTTRASQPPLAELPNDERIIYASATDELQHSELDDKNLAPLLFIVSVNIIASTLSVWNVTVTADTVQKTTKSRSLHKSSGKISHRRSSFASRLSTGATTPVGRSQSSIVRDIGFDDGYVQEESLLLDAAFENPAAPSKAARRVSSLLVRADLSNSKDSMHSDHPAAHQYSQSSHKESFMGSYRVEAPPPVSDISFYGTQTDVSSDDADELENVREGYSSVSGSARTIKRAHHTLLEKVHCIDCSHVTKEMGASPDITDAFHVLTMLYPDAPGKKAHAERAVMMCIMNREHEELQILQIKAVAHRQRSRMAPYSSPNPGGYKLRISGTMRPGIADTQLLVSGTVKRILVLESRGGAFTIQAPWTNMMKLTLPTRLYEYDTHQLATHGLVPDRNRGGRRRILERSSCTFVSLCHGTRNGCIDLVDSQSIKHRVHISLVPSDSFVSKIVVFCQAVLQHHDEPILRGWSDVMSWLQHESDEKHNLEWTAILIVLFSNGLQSTQESPIEAGSRPKRRKGPLLRSSSGANTDLESWNTMVLQESSISSSQPSWLEDPAWSWALGAKADNKTSFTEEKARLSSSDDANQAAIPLPEKSPHMLSCVSLARKFLTSAVGKAAFGDQGYMPTASSRPPTQSHSALASMLIALHLLREECLLDTSSQIHSRTMTPALAQLGIWLGWQSWSNIEGSYYMLEDTDSSSWLFDQSSITAISVPTEPFPPPSIFRYFEGIILGSGSGRFLTMSAATEHIMSQDSMSSAQKSCIDLKFTPRSHRLLSVLGTSLQIPNAELVSRMLKHGIDISFLETLPSGMAIPFRMAIAECREQPPLSWTRAELTLVGRDDLVMLREGPKLSRIHRGLQLSTSQYIKKDAATICNQALDVDSLGAYDGSTESDRQHVMRLLFKEDQRFVEAAKLVHPLQYPVVQCSPDPTWTEQQYLEAQQELSKLVAVRTLSVSLGRGLLFYGARLPLITEKFPIHGFTLSCVMKPSDSTVTADRSGFTEEKVSWAFFHAGAEAGLTISRNARGIDTSWILFNKPRDLSNRHAGFLLALGLNGHLKNIAKWVAFKYLTPKHNMTSIGLLLGLSASHLGTMDVLVTRLLSVHVTRMLPPGAAELNLSPLTQTCGLMGIGLLYCRSQHRRMSEIMLSEIESRDEDDGSDPLDTLKDEGYRLAAGFALGFINLGKGNDLGGLHDMKVTERLLTLAISTKKVDIVHIIDKSTAASTIAIALIFMKTGSVSLARKIDIPDTKQLYDYVRPDQFLLRTLAKHLILWDRIRPEQEWLTSQLPTAYKGKSCGTVTGLTTEDLPYFNVVAGICLAIGLRYAGSGRSSVRDLLCNFLDQFMRICRLTALTYDAKLARTTVRNCQDIVALSVACVMAGTGDIVVLRRLRSLHGRVDADRPYGSYLAAHFAIGVLFVGGGTHTLGTSDVAVASLVCAFYPLFPATYLDNKSHLQAFRHFWVLATERRCLIPRDIDSHRPISLSIMISLKDGSIIQQNAPCLLPEIASIDTIKTMDSTYMPITLSLSSNAGHLAAFNAHQSIYVRRRNNYDAAQTSMFSATMRALNDDQINHSLHSNPLECIFSLEAFRNYDRAERALVLPPDESTAITSQHRSSESSVVDDRLLLETGTLGHKRSDRLWSLRILLAWAQKCEERGEKIRWLGEEVIERLRNRVALLVSEQANI